MGTGNIYIYTHTRLDIQSSISKEEVIELKPTTYCS